MTEAVIPVWSCRFFCTADCREAGVSFFKILLSLQFTWRWVQAPIRISLYLPGGDSHNLLKYAAYKEGLC